MVVEGDRKGIREFFREETRKFLKLRKKKE
jgi:hypothetical protein